MQCIDYILISLATAPGEGLIDQHTRQGWLLPKRYNFRNGEPISILQHPDGGELKFAFDDLAQASHTYRMRAFSTLSIQDMDHHASTLPGIL